MKECLGGCGLAVGCLFLGFPAEAATFTFTKIADESDSFFSGNFSLPALNDSGTVVFRGSSDKVGEGIFTGSGGAITTIADTQGPFFGFPDNFAKGPVINNAGTVAFNALLDDGSEGIFTSRNGSITTIADTNGPFSRFSSPTINNRGTLAFKAFLDDGVEGIFTSSGGVITAIADSRGPFSSFSQLFGIPSIPAINNQNAVAFRALLNSGEAGIFVSDGKTITTIADTKGQFSDFGSEPDINDQGIVAFLAGLDQDFRPDLPDQGEGIFISDKGEITAIADTNGPVFGEFRGFSNPGINNQGTVAFSYSDVDAIARGIFNGPDPVLNQVTKDIDSSLAGDKGEFGFGAINNQGQIAFLSGDYAGIYRADPVSTPVPEPSNVAGLFALAGLGALSSKLRDRRKVGRKIKS